MILREIKAEALYLWKGILKQFRIDFGAVRTWIQIFLAVVMLCISGFSGWLEIGRRENRADIRKLSQQVKDVRDSVRIVDRYHEKAIAQIHQQMHYMVLASAKREQAIKQLIELLRKNGISEQEALDRVDKMNQTELEQYFSTFKNE